MLDFVINEYNKAEKTIYADHEKLVVMIVNLKNGYILVEYSICMDPNEFVLEEGIDICKEKVINKLLEIYEPVEIKNPNKTRKWGGIR